MLSTSFKEIEPYLRERARQTAERRTAIVIERSSYQNATIELCQRLSILMERRQDPSRGKTENIYYEEESKILRQKLCLI